MPIPLFHVNAFTDRCLEGNPAAVCPPETWLTDETLRAIAAENNFSETAFFVRRGEIFDLRWFTPRCEVDLCGHATLASAFVILTILHPQLHHVCFETRSGALMVRREGDLLAMDFPALPPWESSTPPAILTGAFKPARPPTSILQVKDNYFVVLETEGDVRGFLPNFSQLERLHPAGLAITAPGDHSDFVSRYFAPSYGVPEDPVTGSTHCSLAPYWAQRLGKDSLHARQVSQRGGELWCQVAGDRVIIKGKAMLTLQGSLMIG